MDFSIPGELALELRKFKDFLNVQLTPYLSTWYEQEVVPRSFFAALAKYQWLGHDENSGSYVEQTALKQAVLMEHLAKLSPGVAVAVLVQTSLGIKGLSLFASEKQKRTYAGPAVRGETLICLGNTEPSAGSDVANLAAKAEKVDGGWLLNGTKAYVTNGTVSDLALITAIADPDAPRNRRVSMFLVDLSSKGVARKKLHKQVWIPSDLSRITMKDVFVPEGNLIGERGRGLQQVLTIFMHSRVNISALTLGTATGAFELGVEHMRRREIFGKKLREFQAKAFEAADFFTRIEAARLMLWKACRAKDQGADFQLEASMAKYLSVGIAREVGAWAADLFGAASVLFEHPVHKYPLDAWASSLAEGTQDVQKLIISRAILGKVGPGAS